MLCLSYLLLISFTIYSVICDNSGSVSFGIALFWQQCMKLAILKHCKEFFFSGLFMEVDISFHFYPFATSECHEVVVECVT